MKLRIEIDSNLEETEIVDAPVLGEEMTYEQQLSLWRAHAQRFGRSVPIRRGRLGGAESATAYAGRSPCHF